MSNKELKCCPFCGGEAEMYTNNDFSGYSTYIQCTDCGARTIGFDTTAYSDGYEHMNRTPLIEAIVNAWNRRNKENR